MFFGRKAGLFTVLAAAALAFGGCGADGSVDEAQARRWYEEMQGYGSVTHDSDFGGTYHGGTISGRDNTERNTYGMQSGNDMNGGTGINGSAGLNGDMHSTNGGTTLGDDLRNAWDNMKNDVKNMGEADRNNK